MPPSKSEFWQPGKKYFIRTVTMYQIGELVRVEGPNKSELILKDAAWIPLTGRFAQSVKDGDVREVEPYPDGMEVLVNRSAIIDACEWTNELPRAQK